MITVYSELKCLQVHSQQAVTADCPQKPIPRDCQHVSVSKARKSRGNQACYSNVQWTCSGGGTQAVSAVSDNCRC
jgi:hypothetical protein